MLVWNFVRCAWTNVYTRVGYILLFIALCSLGLCWVSLLFLIPTILFGIGCILPLLITDFGLETFCVHRRTLRRYARSKRIRLDYLRTFYDGFYCDRKGFVLACRDIVKKHGANALGLHPDDEYRIFVEMARLW